MIILLLKTSKKSYYASYFLENKSNIKETWKCIKSIKNLNKKAAFQLTKIKIPRGYIDDRAEIANEFNKFFSTIGNKIDEKQLQMINHSPIISQKRIKKSSFTKCR